MRTIEDICLMLPANEKAELIKILSHSLVRENGWKKPRKESIDFAIETMNGIVGFNVTIPDRHWNVVNARVVLAYHLLLCGYTQTQIANRLNISRVNLCSMRNKMESAIALPKQYADIINIWKQFQEIIDKDEI